MQRGGERRIILSSNMKMLAYSFVGMVLFLLCPPREQHQQQCNVFVSAFSIHRSSPFTTTRRFNHPVASSNSQSKNTKNQQRRPVLFPGPSTTSSCSSSKLFAWNNKDNNPLVPSRSASGASFEGLMEQLPSNTVVNAIVDLVKRNENTENRRSSSRRTRSNRTGVVAADVAALAGVSLSQAQRDLSVLASLSGGDLAVDSETGELIYYFDKELSNKLTQNSVQYKSRQLLQKAWPYLFWTLRVSFGVALVASIAAIFSAIFFIQTSSSSSDDRDDNRDRRSSGGMPMMGGGWSYWWGPSPFDFFYYRPYGYYGYYGRRQMGDTTRTTEEEMGFLESVFSYVFGDGNPNTALEQERLQYAAAMIRQNQGSVTAEQLAPFCQDDIPEVKNEEDDDLLSSSETIVDESFVLPIVTALNGEPRVTDDGDIVYVFPDLQVTAASTTSDMTSTAAGSEQQRREALILRRAGLPETASTRDIQRLLEYNGYRNLVRSRGIVERQDLIQVLEQLVPPLTALEEDELSYKSDSTVLQEKPWKFTLASDLNKILAGGLGIVNLGGALYLGNLFQQIQAAMNAGANIALPPWLSLVQGLYPFLLGYAVLFNVIPIARNFWIQQQNQKIQQRNDRRQQWKELLQQATSSSYSLSGQSLPQSRGRRLDRIRRKLQAAKRMGTKLFQAGKTKLFDTAETTLEDLQQQKSDQALQDFDQQLSSSSSSSSKETNNQNNNNNQLPSSSSSTKIPSTASLPNEEEEEKRARIRNRNNNDSN